jgi:hypothetical protein
MLTEELQLSACVESEHTLGAIDHFCVKINGQGQVLSTSAGEILLSRTLGNSLEGGLGRMFLRVHVGDSIELHTLQGALSELSSFAC